MEAFGIPFVSRTREENHITVVDIFEVPDEHISPIDRLEGHPGWYERTLIDDIEGVEPFSIYLCEGGGGHHIPSGDYLNQEKKRERN